MGGYVFQSAFFEYLRPKRLLVWILVGLGLYAAAALYLNVANSKDLVESYATLSSLLVFRLLPLASAIFSSAVLSQEIEQKTIVYMLTRPIPRQQFLLFRTIASALVVFIVSAFAACAVSVAVFGSGGLSSQYLHRDLIAIFVGALAYGTLFVLVSLIINRSMVVTLLFAFAWETSVPGMPGSVYLISISSYLTAIAQRPSSGVAATGGNPLGAIATVLGTNTLSATTGWIVVIVLIAFFGGLGAWWFKHFEYLPREDAE